LPALDPQREYHLYGWAEDASSSRRAVTFTLAELRAQDSILMQGEYDKKTDSWPNVHVSADEFRGAVDRMVSC
jgi:hypothetical protein